MGINKHIEEYIEYYVSLKSSPNYAVLIKGSWGSGKSFFIKKFIENDQARKYLYVSLYGISSFDDIETAFFKQLNPRLASEGMQFAGAVLKGLFKSTFKLDINLFGDSKSDGSISTVLPDLKIFESFKKSNEHILVFDDLERCSLPLQDVMGYINQLVENDNLKAIIIANEDDILVRSTSVNEDSGIEENIVNDERNNYSRIKEKLIGKTFAIEIDLDSSVDQFLDNVNSVAAKELLLENVQVIKSIFTTSNYENLRYIKQAFLDFERFLSFTPEVFLVRKDLVKKIIEIYFAFTFELKKGKLKERNILEIFNIKTFINSAKHTYTIEIAKKYGVFDRLYNPIEGQIWYDYFTSNVVDTAAIEQSIYNSVYFLSENTPKWKKLKNYWTLEKGQFDELYKQVYKDLSETNINDQVSLLHIIDMFLFFAKNNIISDSSNDIMDLAVKNIHNMKTKGLLNFELDNRFSLERSLGVDFIDPEDVNLKNLYSQLKDAVESTRTESYYKIAEHLLEVLEKSIDDFEYLLLINNLGISKFHDTPILKYIDQKKFSDVFWKLTSLDQRHLGRIFVKRYDYNEFNMKLNGELLWLKEMYRFVKEKNDENADRLMKYLIEDGFFSCVNAAIQSLEESKT